jgi:hypothetical protein
VISPGESHYVSELGMIQGAMWQEIDYLQSALWQQWYGLSEGGKGLVLLAVVIVLFSLTRNAESNAIIALSALTGLVVIAYFIIFFMARY